MSHRAKLHQQHLDIPIARVLTVTTSAARAEAMRHAAHRFIIEPMHLPPGLFLFGADERSGLFEAVWINAESAPMSLVPPRER